MPAPTGTGAGHDAPYLLFPGRPPGRLSESGGPPLCVVDEFPYEASRYRMRRGEILCLVTDGVTDATNAAGDFYGRARLEVLLASTPPEAGPEEVGEAVRRDVERFAAGVEAADDMALVILRPRPYPAARARACRTAGKQDGPTSLSSRRAPMPMVAA